MRAGASGQKQALLYPVFGTQPMIAKPAIDSKQRRITANKLSHPKRQSGLHKPADETEKRQKSADSPACIVRSIR
jgi:hypothetical protein